MSSAYELQRAAQQARNREILQSFGLTRQVAPAVPSASAPAPTTPKKRKTTAQSPFSTPVRGEGSEAGTPGSAGSRSSARIKTRIAREELGEDFEDDVELVGGLLEDYDDDLELGEDGAGRKRKLSSGRRGSDLLEGKARADCCSTTQYRDRGRTPRSLDISLACRWELRGTLGWERRRCVLAPSLSAPRLTLTRTGWNPRPCRRWNLWKRREGCLVDRTERRLRGRQ